MLFKLPAREHPSPASLAHHYELKDELDGSWAARPIELLLEHGRAMLVLEDPGGEPLAWLLGAPMQVGVFLRLAVGIAGPLGKLHQRGLVHKDLKPAHILVNCADGEVRLTGFGIASRLPRERQKLESPETIAGTLASRADRTDEPLDRFAQRPLFARRHILPDTHGLAAVHRVRPDGVGLLPHREKAGAARRANPECAAPVSQLVMKLLAKTAEERYRRRVSAS